MTAAAHLRNMLGPLMRGAYDIRVSGAHHVPRHGGVLVIAERTGLLDVSVLATSLPRPVTVVVESRVDPRRGASLGSTPGRIMKRPQAPLQPVFHAALAAVYAGEAVAAFPLDHIRAVEEAALGFAGAYVSACSGIGVIPVALSGTHGLRSSDPPGFRAPIHVVIGPMQQRAPVADPGSRRQVLGRAEDLRQILSDHLHHTRRRLLG